MRLYHPDRPGGSNEKMSQANAARDALKARVGNGSVGRPAGEYGQGDSQERNRAQEYRDMDEKRKAYAQVARDAANKHLNIPAFVQHFTTIFGEPFVVTKQEWKKENPTVASYDAQFENGARSIVLSFSIYIDYTELYRSRSIAADGSGLSMSIISDILYNRKKVKLTQSNYRMDNQYKVLSDPEQLFPAEKLIYHSHH